MRELPPSTVKVSDDTVIVGQQTEEGKPPMAMKMDIDVVVGEDKLSFAGFRPDRQPARAMCTSATTWTPAASSGSTTGVTAPTASGLTVRRARLLFAGPIDQPYLDIEAIRQTDDVIAGIRLSGSAEQPTTQIFSEPAMSQEQALSYLVLGRPLSTNGEDNNMLAQAALGLGLMGSSGVTGGLAKNLGIRGFPARYPGQRQRHQRGRQRQYLREAQPALWRRRVRTGQHHCLALQAEQEGLPRSRRRRGQFAGYLLQAGFLSPFLQEKPGIAIASKPAPTRFSRIAVREQRG